MSSDSHKSNSPESGAPVQVPTFEELTQDVRRLVGRPINKDAVAATLESMGMRHRDAKTDYGVASLFELADRIYDTIMLREQEERRKAHGQSDEGSAQVLSHNIREKAAFFFQYYGQGLLFSVPMISQVIAIILFRYSLWAWLEFNEAQATMVALGTIFAFVITGGFVQATGRQITGFKSEQNYLLAYRAGLKILMYGILTVLVTGVLLYLLNIAIPFYPGRMVIIGGVYMLFISLLILSSAILYALAHRMAIIAGVVLGTVFVIYAMNNTLFGIYWAHWSGLTIALIFLMGYIYFYFKIKIKRMPPQLRKQRLSGFEIFYYSNYAYFLYGALYFLFLFMDRLMAWSAGGENELPYIFWFDTIYELGMDWALITLILTIAVLEYSINAFSYQLIPVLKQVNIRYLDKFNRWFASFYRRQLWLLLIIGIISLIVSYYGVLSLRVYQTEIPELRDFFSSVITYKVFWLGSLGYLLLTGGLLNVLFFFTLNRPLFALKALTISVIVNFIVGFVCSRVISYEYAVLGLVFGSLTFLILTGLKARYFFRNLDYYYYSAF